MKKKSFSARLEEFKKEFISERAEEMASNKRYIKGFVVNVMGDYKKLLTDFLDKNQKTIINIVKGIEKNSNDSMDNCFLTELNFVNSIPKLLILRDNKINIDYEFMENYFFEIKDKEKANELNDSLKALQEKIVLDKNDSFSDIEKIYKYGNFILTFLNSFDFRKEIAVLLLSACSKFGNDAFEIIINQHFIYQKGSETNWNGGQVFNALNFVKKFLQKFKLNAVLK